jgi:hypothetical protein
MQLTYDLGQLLTAEECENLALEVLEEQSKGVLRIETDERYYRNSYGGITTGSWDTLKRFTPLIVNTLGREVRMENPYCRVYNNTSTLNEHIDRPGLDWTASLCLFNNLDTDWPLHVRINENEVQSFPTQVGSAALMRGGTLPHWRDPLSCRDDQYVVMMFLHWSDPV